MKKMKSGMKAGIFNMKKMKSGINKSEFEIDTVSVNSRQDLIDWVKETGLSIGYVIVIKISKANEHVSFHCDVGGKYTSKKTSTRNTGTKKCDCPFGLEGKYLYDDCWTLSVICDIHNHEPALHLEGHAYARRLSESRELALMKAYDIAFPNAKGFWRKLSLSPYASLGDDDLGCQVKVEVENFNTEFKKQSRAGKKSLLRKMKEITMPSETSLNEPATQKATGGRSSFKRAPTDQPSQTQD
nr:hypothetical protein [Tanacetum cinerariifolium]